MSGPTAWRTAVQARMSMAGSGAKAIKLHTWMPPVSFAPDVDMDIRACAAVREAVGPNVPLMLDGYHSYSRTDALRIGRALQRLDFTWFEEMMNEQSMASYVWLAEQLDIPILGPESLSGKHHSRADWIKAGASDILRAGVTGVGGISPALKVAHMAEGFGMNCEVHGNGAANLAVCAAVRNCRWYERGLLHPFLDYDEVPAYLHRLPDPMDAQGYVHLSQAPGLGEDIHFDNPTLYGKDALSFSTFNTSTKNSVSSYTCLRICSASPGCCSSCRCSFKCNTQLPVGPTI